jgi:lipoprotein-anchoring transpeptidase ErfK/SrfK
VVVVSTDVTTGMPDLPTPTGTFKIMAKYSPFQFISPWPRGSPYFYEPLWSDYALLFADGGYFIHDAWWQQNFGPGGNLKTGSHGCVNVPVPQMPNLYKWAQVGDRVVVVA